MTLRVACQAFATAEQLLDSNCACALDAEDDAELIDEMLDEASDLLAQATGHAVTGICTVTVRPVALCDDNFDPFYPAYDRTSVRDWRRQFGGLNSIPLRGPNVDVVEVIIDGTVLNPSEYGLLDGRYLFRRAGCWPSVNDLKLETTEPDTFGITYRFGTAGGALGRMACIELACELIKDAKGKSSSLPRGVTSANIQGASISVRDRAAALRDGEEQIPVISRFLANWAPDGPNAVVGVWSPELEQAWNLVQVEGPSGS
jgi:hypothetical protein